jgi:hypothetical protein
MRRQLGFLLALLAGAPVAALALGQAPTQSERETFFVQKVAPLLRENCLQCHNPEKTKGGLDLSTRAAALEGGDKGPAVVPGDAGKSPLLQMVSGPEPRMPRQARPLSEQQRADLRQWIDDGAAWPKGLTLAAAKDKGKDELWWSLQPLNRPAVPAVKDAAWVRNPIDAFVLAGQEARGLSPSPAADRATFIRRVTYDLLGLPPTPEEIDGFVNDTAADAFEQLIERLLASPLYGERWARLWLDLIHYADTHGFDKDKRRLWAWLFRDWVIGAFNRDLPYRRFIRYQLAGDVCYPDDPDGMVATGFVAAGPWDFVGHVELREGTVEKEKTRTLDRDDMVMNAMSTFVSQTVHCARCHDHKFDPIPQRDYYKLQAVFAGVERGDRVVFSKQAQEQKAQREAAREQLLTKQRQLLKQIEGLQSDELTRLEADLAALRKRLAALPRPVTAQKSPSNGYHSAIVATRDTEKWVQIDLEAPRPIDLVRLWPARPTDFADTPGFGFPARFRVAISDDPTFAKAEVIADHTAADFPNPGDNPVTIPAGGKTARYVRITATLLWQRTGDYVFALAEAQVEAGGKNVARGATVTARDSIEAGRWSKKYLVDHFDSRNAFADLDDPQIAKALHEREDLARQIHQLARKGDALRDKLVDADTRRQLDETAGRLTAVESDLKLLKESAKVYAVVPIKPRPIHVLQRGDVERKGDLVTPGGLSLLPGLPSEFKLANPDDEGQRRAALAEWIADDHNVLTWRSIVNRIWQYHFGRGLVDTPSDFGRNGARPTHPALLDWLACEFRDFDSFKRLHRLILLSNTYRQAVAHHAAHAKIDADNRFLWRMNRQRLDAESIRDAVLFVSGKLSFQMGGPGYDLFRFKDDHSPVYDHMAVERIHDPATWRRTVYRFVVRSVPNPFLDSLDCADPNVNVPVRNTTLTALQALALMNNPLMVKQAEYFAERLRQVSADADVQVTTAYRLAFGRPPSAQERAALVAYAGRHGLANACRLLFNANEFVFVD